MNESNDKPVTEQEPPSTMPRLIWPIGGAVVVTVLFVGWAFLAVDTAPTGGGQPLGSGSFGDAFGALTGFVTALGLVGAVYGIYQQHIALQQQRQEAAQARREFAAQLEAAREATEMQRKELAMARKEYARQARAAEDATLATHRLARATEQHTRANQTTALLHYLGWTTDSKVAWLSYQIRAEMTLADAEILLAQIEQLPAPTNTTGPWSNHPSDAPPSVLRSQVRFHLEELSRQQLSPTEADGTSSNIPASKHIERLQTIRTCVHERLRSAAQEEATAPGPPPAPPPEPPQP